MSDQSTDRHNQSSSSTKKTYVGKAALIVAVTVAAVVVAISIVVLSTSWSAHGDAKAEVVAAENELSDAQAGVIVANGYYDDANAAYDAWYYCYISTSWRYDWMCGSEAAVTSDLDFASTLVDTAESQVRQAELRVRSTNSDLTDAANTFNQNAWIWGSLSALSVIAIIVLTTIAIRNKSTQRKAEEHDARPDWECPECSSHNEGGMFCISCGFAKSEIDSKKSRDMTQALLEKEE